MPRTGLRKCRIYGKVMYKDDSYTARGETFYFHRWYEWRDDDCGGIEAVMEDEKGNVVTVYDVHSVQFIDAEEAI